MEQKRERIWELDALRGFCIVCVIFVHFMFDLVYFLGKQVDFPPLYTFIQQYGGAIFVVLSGCCATVRDASELQTDGIPYDSGAACWSLGAVC